MATERCFLEIAVPRLLTNKSWQLKQYPWKVTVKDFTLSKVGSLQPDEWALSLVFFRYFSNF